ncbi:hypothetical protein XBJ1_0721 [Xenorhabdus bovienii SS-2004]|uniref:Uncharacterized protein n=1 Tax=Xenorhabdus bovienii (strain SS-2004) TaxID=406818 RepID=D3UWM7_XENBS|nr:hypothetical protein XBJ1_0721 [Xenorhabdus bovienii SS-2004]
MNSLNHRVQDFLYKAPNLNVIIIILNHKIYLTLILTLNYKYLLSSYNYPVFHEYIGSDSENIFNINDLSYSYYLNDAQN